MSQTAHEISVEATEAQGVGHHDAGHHEPTELEPDNVNTAAIGVFVAGLLIVLVLLVVAVSQLFTQATQKKLVEKVYSRVDPSVALLRTQEAERLNEYRWVNQSGGVVRIPTERAVELTLAEWGARASAAAEAADAETAAAGTDNR